MKVGKLTSYYTIFIILLNVSTALMISVAES